MIPGNGPGPGLECAPGWAVALRVIGATPHLVCVVSKRDDRAGHALDQGGRRAVPILVAVGNVACGYEYCRTVPDRFSSVPGHQAEEAGTCDKQCGAGRDQHARSAVESAKSYETNGKAVPRTRIQWTLLGTNERHHQLRCLSPFLRRIPDSAAGLHHPQAEGAIAAYH